jgi:hypothetical protein
MIEAKTSIRHMFTAIETSLAFKLSERKGIYREIIEDRELKSLTRIPFRGRIQNGLINCFHKFSK